MIGETTTTPRREAAAPVFEPEGRTQLLPPWAVILHNDDVNTMDHVVASLLKSVPTLKSIQAIEIMIEAHNQGKAVVIMCPLELAELYRDRLQGFSLGATIEKG